MRYKITESSIFTSKKVTIKEFKYKWLAKLYTFWHYGTADPAWQGSFKWKIEEINDS